MRAARIVGGDLSQFFNFFKFFLEGLIRFQLLPIWSKSVGFNTVSFHIFGGLWLILANNHHYKCPLWKPHILGKSRTIRVLDLVCGVCRWDLVRGVCGVDFVCGVCGGNHVVGEFVCWSIVFAQERIPFVRSKLYVRVIIVVTQYNYYYINTCTRIRTQNETMAFVIIVR